MQWGHCLTPTRFSADKSPVPWVSLDGLFTGFTLAAVSLPCGAFTWFTSTSVNGVACALFTTLTVGGVSRVVSPCLTISRNCPSCLSVKPVPPLSVMGLAWAGRPRFALLRPVAAHVVPLVIGSFVHVVSSDVFKLLVSGLTVGLSARKKSPKLLTLARFPSRCMTA